MQIAKHAVTKWINFVKNRNLKIGPAQAAATTLLPSQASSFTSVKKIAHTGAQNVTKTLNLLKNLKTEMILHLMTTMITKLLNIKLTPETNKKYVNPK